ncbi:MAG TPA: SgcJ/EcaC family oxidoreductase, partial [Blastococcus sp.]
GHWPSGQQPEAEKGAAPRGARREEQATMHSKLSMRVATVSGVVLLAGAVGAGVAGADAFPAPAVEHSVSATARQDQTTEGGQPTQQQIAALFDQWNAALATGNPEKVADLYAADAVLLPTLSPQIRTTRAEIVDYFAHLLPSNPQAVITQEIITVLDRNDAINTGLYTFTLTQNGVQQQVPARYTFVYRRTNGEWLIVNHHSSVVPEASTP